MPQNLLVPGAVLPVDVVNPQGQLVLRRGAVLEDVAQLDRLCAHKPCISPEDARAWQRAYEREVQRALRSNAQGDLPEQVPMPAAINDEDYVEPGTHFFRGDWLDAQELLRVLLFHGGLFMDPMPRLRMLEERVTHWIQTDADDSLFRLFQALAKPSLGYSATHALLCLTITQLTAEKLGLDVQVQRALRFAALTMNIGIGRIQDAMALQSTPLTAEQRVQVQARPKISHDILQGFGLNDPLVLDLVRWHHEPAHELAHQDHHLPRLVLHMANVLVAKMAARQTRASLSPKSAERAMYLTASNDQDSATVSAAMAAAVGFFPPGSYVVMNNGDTAIAVRRGSNANTPWVVPIADARGLPYGQYVALDTSQRAHGIAQGLNFERVRLNLQIDKVLQARDRTAGLRPA